MKGKRLLVFGVAMCLLASLFAGGAKESATAAERVVTTVTRSTYANETWYTEMNAAFTAETGIRVHVEATPGTDHDHVTKVNIDLLAGGDIDVIETNGPRDYGARREAGFFAPLNILLREKGIDETAIWGKYIEYSDDGSFYAIPAKQEMNCVFYNKKLFDQAGVPYPTAPWTWDEYIAIAEQITRASGGKVYGSYMNLDTPYYYIVALQKGIPFYKEDGSCNFDHPEFAANLEWYKRLGNDPKIQMDAKEYKAIAPSWNYFATVDNLAMYCKGNWFTRLLNSQEEYPRDWDYGIVAMPTSGTAESNKSLQSFGYISINKNAAHMEEAIEYAVWRAKNQWKFEGGIPALVNLTEAEQAQIFDETAKESRGSITVDDLYNTFIDNGMDIVASDILGPVGSEYHIILSEEAELFMLDLQDLPTTLKNICDRVDEAIRNL